MGATLEIQRQQRMDLLDQQMLLAHYSEARRNTRQQPRVRGPHAPEHGQRRPTHVNGLLTVCLCSLACSTGPDYSPP